MQKAEPHSLPDVELTDEEVCMLRRIAQRRVLGASTQPSPVEQDRRSK